MHSQIGPVIVDLIEELEIQLDQEFYSYYKMESPKEALPMLETPVMLTTGTDSLNVEMNKKNPPVRTIISNDVKATSPNSSQVNIIFLFIYEMNAYTRDSLEP